MEPGKKTLELLAGIFDKYRLSGQEADHYLEGLLVSNYEPYWDYLRLDTLLSLQKPKTGFHDEMIFIAYHQICELYFKLMLHELEAIAGNPGNAALFEEGLVRLNRYLKNLIESFDIMTYGMRAEEFLKFRMALLPASGFQSGQFRMVELRITGVENLVTTALSGGKPEKTEDLYENIYWKKGAIDLGTGEKTLTLKQFEKQYDKLLLQLAEECRENNLYGNYKRLLSEGKLNAEVTSKMRELDQNLNVNWRLAHYRSAVRYLHGKKGDVEATGGTNWQKYLPPRFQRVVSFPELWSNEELDNWGRQWVHDQID